MPKSCARCGCAEGLALYATSRVKYFGCASCRYLNVVHVGPELESPSVRSEGGTAELGGAPTLR